MEKLGSISKRHWAVLGGVVLAVILLTVFVSNGGTHRTLGHKDVSYLTKYTVTEKGSMDKPSTHQMTGIISGLTKWTIGNKGPGTSMSEAFAGLGKGIQSVDSTTFFKDGTFSDVTYMRGLRGSVYMLYSGGSYQVTSKHVIKKTKWTGNINYNAHKDIYYAKSGAASKHAKPNSFKLTFDDRLGDRERSKTEIKNERKLEKNIGKMTRRTIPALPTDKVVYKSAKAAYRSHLRHLQDGYSTRASQMEVDGF